jgi:HEAT repeat protein
MNQQTTSEGNSPSPAANTAVLDKAFEALRTYERGSGRGRLAPIDEAVRSCLGNEPARKELERRLLAALKSHAPPVARQFVCGKLRLVGSAESVPALAELLSDDDLAHAAGAALQAMPCREAGRALLERLPRLSGPRLVGAINSLGARREAGAARGLTALLESPDLAVSGAAAGALGSIGTAEAARCLRKFQPKAPAALGLAVADACLACAEWLLAEGKKAEALAIYKLLSDPKQPKHVRLAAQQGVSLATRGK